MDKVEIRVGGRIDEHWSEWFEGLTVTYAEQDRTLLSGTVVDQAALYGVLIRLRDLGLPLVSVNVSESADKEADKEGRDATACRQDPQAADSDLTQPEGSLE